MQIRGTETNKQNTDFSRTQRFWPSLFTAICTTLCLLPTPVRADIAVTLPALAGIVSMLDNQAHVFCLLPGNADPHHFQLTARTIERLRQARLLIRTSSSDAGWNLHPTVPSLDLWPDTSHGWLRPLKVHDILPLLANQLQKIHPERKLLIGHALKHALKTCDRLQLAWKNRLTSYRKTGFIMQHPAWQGLMDDLDIPVWMVLEKFQHGHELGPKRLERAMHLLSSRPGIRLLGDTRHSNRALFWLAQHGKVPEPTLLDAVGNCSIGWKEMMQKNMAWLKPL